MKQEIYDILCSIIEQGPEDLTLSEFFYQHHIPILKTLGIPIDNVDQITKHVFEPIQLGRFTDMTQFAPLLESQTCWDFVVALIWHVHQSCENSVVVDNVTISKDPLHINIYDTEYNLYYQDCYKLVQFSTSKTIDFSQQSEALQYAQTSYYHLIQGMAFGFGAGVLWWLENN